MYIYLVSLGGTTMCIYIYIVHTHIHLYDIYLYILYIHTNTCAFMIVIYDRFDVQYYIYIQKIYGSMDIYIYIYY